jgi:hypothetical protein
VVKGQIDLILAYSMNALFHLGNLWFVLVVTFVQMTYFKLDSHADPEDSLADEVKDHCHDVADGGAYFQFDCTLRSHFPFIDFEIRT